MAELKPAGYQLVPLTKLLASRRNAILICDGVGVGKTISAGYILCFLTAAFGRPGLVICPPGLQDKWYLELKSKFEVDVVPIRSKEELDLNSDYWDCPTPVPRVFVIPSSILPQASKGRFKGPVVIDEIHNYRNHATTSWKAAKALTALASHRIGLSATPINNGMSDLSAELSILLNIDFHIADAVVADAWRPETRSILYTMMTRFSKDRLGIHFARRIVHDLSVPVPEAYAEQIVATVKSLRSRPKSEIIYRDEITYFRLGASSPTAFMASTGVKVHAEFNKNATLLRLLEQHADEPVIVFVVFEETAKELSSLISGREAYLLTGSVPVFQREEILDQFRNTSNGVLVMTSVGAEGIDLQFCATLVNFDLVWNPMVLEQRIGRIDRVGQKKSVITIYNMVVNGSIDECILRTLGRKLGLIQGSILEPSTILGAYDENKVHLFTEGELEEESKKAEALASAVELSAAIIPQDYSVIAEIDLTYCGSRAIREAALRSKAPTWLSPGEVSQEWHRHLSMSSVQLERLIARYEGNSGEVA